VTGALSSDRLLPIAPTVSILDRDDLGDRASPVALRDDSSTNFVRESANSAARTADRI
jgi:hypothetical protein